jgi:hypothetical protein
LIRILGDWLVGAAKVIVKCLEQEQKKLKTIGFG